MPRACGRGRACRARVHRSRRARPLRRAPGRVDPSLQTIALSHGHRVAWLHPFDRRSLRRELLQLVGGAGQQAERAPVAGDDALHVEQLDGDGSFLRAHRVMVADRDHRDVRLVDAADQLHVAEHAGVAGEVDLLVVLGRDDDARRLAGVRAVRRRAGVERIRERELHAVHVDGAALVRCLQLALVDALLAEPACELDECDDRRTVLLREVDGVADVVAVAVGDRDHVDALRRLLVRRALRVAGQERVDVDALPAGGVEPEGCMSEPGQRRVCHRSPLAGRRERNVGGPSYAGANLLGLMGSRLLPLSLALGMVLADATGLHHVAFYLALLAIIGGAAAAFDAVSRYLEGTGGLVRAATTGLALALLVLGSAVRESAAVGGHVPAVSISAAIAAMLLYASPLLGWFLAPLAPKPASRPVRVPLL